MKKVCGALNEMCPKHAIELQLRSAVNFACQKNKRNKKHNEQEEDEEANQQVFG